MEKRSHFFLHMNKDANHKHSKIDDSSRRESTASKIDDSSRRESTASNKMDISASSTNSGIATERSSVQFPWRLHELLTEAETNGNDVIVSWIPGTNNAFKVHNKEKFTNEILPAYFSATKYKSFQRNLNLWGFESMTDGPNRGACHHPIFVRGDREKCHYMTRYKVKGHKQKQQEVMTPDDSNGSQTDEEMNRARLPSISGLSSAFNLQLQSPGLHNLADVKTISFCEKLHRILAVPELQGCIRWTADRRCIAILNPYQFNGFLFNNYFPNTNFCSFLAELESYGFKNISHSGLKDCYYHDLMIQGCEHLCKYLATPEDSRRFKSEDPSKDLQHGPQRNVQGGKPSQPLQTDPSIQHLLQLQQVGLGNMLPHADPLSGLALTSIGGQSPLPSLNSPLPLLAINMQNRSAALVAYLTDLQRRGGDEFLRGSGRGAQV